ncbi:MAG: urate hydroxylase PuuD [Pseudomonadota bacterium]
MTAYLIEWLNLLVRWLHVIAGIAWIGSSFYFIWLDNHLRAPRNAGDSEKGVAGEVWSVHGGGFYHAQKYAAAPLPLPAPLHWFKWEAYTTWLSGFFLLVLIYWYGASVYLIDPAVMPLSPAAGISIAAAFLFGGWIVYDLLCRSPLANRNGILSFALLILVVFLAWALCQLFGGRAAYIHFGAVLGTIMVANVAMVIIPGQKRMIAAVERGEPIDPQDGLRAKQRSVHNTYFTLPVLFTMTSNHFASVYNHADNWLFLIAISLAGALIRVYFVARHQGRASPLPLAAAAVLLAGVIVAAAPRASDAAGTAQVGMDELRAVVEARCTNCHAAEPSHPAFAAAPGGVLLDSEDEILRNALRIHQQTVVLRAMPIGNLTAITEDERALIDRWYRNLGPAP